MPANHRPAGKRPEQFHRLNEMALEYISCCFASERGSSCSVAPVLHAISGVKDGINVQLELHGALQRLLCACVATCPHTGTPAAVN